MDNSDPKDSLSTVQIKSPKAEAMPEAGAVKKRVGRPKARPPATKPGPRKGDAAILAEYRERMLTSPQSRKVLEKVFEVALDDNHNHQAACLKMVMDRIIPAGALANIAGSGGGKTSVTINITGIGEIEVEPEALEADFAEVD